MTTLAHALATLQTLWYAPALPWQPLKSLDAMLTEQPTMIFAEAAFIVLATFSFVHAMAHGRMHAMAFFGALVGGTANDIFFMVLPFVDNFFHAQGTVMLTPRLPLYIVCVYVCFIYVPVVASWRLSSVTPIARCAASALCGTLFYAPYDLTGAKFLWWSWHDTDAAVSLRWMGVPIGSTLWTLMHGFCFHALLHVLVLRHAAPLRPAAAASALLGLSMLCTPCMMLSMAPFQMHQLRVRLSAEALTTTLSADAQPAIELLQLPGKPDPPSLALALGTLLLVLVRGSTAASAAARSAAAGSTGPNPPALAKEPPIPRLDATLLGLAAGTLVTLLAVMVVGEPAAVVSRGIHQEFGPCGVPEHDLSGYARTKFLCVPELDEDFHLGCVTQRLPPERPSWYTICGRAHSNYPMYVGVAAALCAGSSAALTRMLVGAASQPAAVKLD